MKVEDIKIIKKDGRLQEFNFEKIHKAIGLSAERVEHKINEDELKLFSRRVKHNIKEFQENGKIPILKVHKAVEMALTETMPDVAKSYKDYRNYKTDFVSIFDTVFQESQKIMYIGDKENSNMDSAIVSTKRSLIYSSLNKELYKKYFLTKSELSAHEDGYIYVHDLNSRRDTFNCCLCNVGEVMNNGFEMGNMWYNEPKTLDVAFDVLGDIINATAGQQYGGFTVPRINQILAKYAEKSFNKYKEEYLNSIQKFVDITKDEVLQEANMIAMKKTVRDCEQGYQGIEYKLNSVNSSRGDYPFVTFTFGLANNEFEAMIVEVLLDVHAKGQGKNNAKRQTLFPKLVFIYDENIHGPNKKYEYLFEKALDCSSVSMYPDYLSVSGDDYVSTMYKKYGEVVSPMGCRAFLSPWYEKGGIHPKDENDKPIFEGRANIGVVSLNLPMIYQKAKQEELDFYETLDYYLNMIREIHLRTYDYLGEMKASCNPIMFTQGGAYRGSLEYNEKIASIVETWTASWGITALNELQQLYNKKSLVEDGQFAIEVMEYINKKIDEYKEQDGKLYAIYGTPAESLVGKQVEQFRKKYGIIKNVSDKDYVSNSFHCHVSEDITPIQKQNLEGRFWNLLNGGKIQYCKYPIKYNKEAMKTLIQRAMKLGFYEGVNLDLNYCDDCGEKDFDGEICPHCGSNNIVQVRRMNGYLSYSRVKGESRLNDSKMKEIKERKSM